MNVKAAGKNVKAAQKNGLARFLDEEPAYLADVRNDLPHGPSGHRDDDKIIYTELSTRAAAWTSRCNAESS